MIEKLKQNADKKKENFNEFSTALGRKITSISSAKDELYFLENINKNPTDFINISNGSFFGFEHSKQEEPTPIYVPNEAINHILFCGITRSGKGILAGIKSYEVLQQKNKGLIYIDVKQEAFTPQIIKEELQKQGRENDLIIISYPYDFGYDGINKDDKPFQLHEKLCEALEIASSKDEATGFYKSVERMTLLGVINLVYNHNKDISYPIILETVKNLITDLESIREYKKERYKAKPNIELIEKYNRLYFPINEIEELNYSDDNLSALKTLYIKLFELINNANIYHKHSIDEALYNGKVLYIKADMLSSSSLKMLKILFMDISQKARKKKADCTVIADEISFYATDSLSGALATMAGFGVQYILQLQDLAQIQNDNLRSAILTNCSVKLFYKISDKLTLEYVEKLGGDELVTNYSFTGVEHSYSQTVEPLLNATRVRAMWYKQNAILIAEYFNSAIFISTNFIPVKQEFNWSSTEMNTCVHKSLEKKEKQYYIHSKEIIQQDKESKEDSVLNNF